MKIIPLSEGAFTIDKTKVFVPFNKETDDLQQRAIGSLLVEVQPFAIITQKDIIVIDTGLGFSNRDGILQIHQNLIDNGIDPLDVTKVLLSHLHKDHSGGVAKEDAVLQHQFLSFPQATYYVNKQEFEFATTVGSASYTPKEFALLSEKENVVFTEGNGVIDDYIRYEVTGAHCPYHQAFWIEESGATIFFGGDVAPQLQQMKSRFIAKYDFDGKKCMELRQQWWEQGQQQHWTFLFYHDIKTPYVIL
ncbi:MBL fold metallo-hydrolase [Ferruginibacter yonginensis]|uniref:MBL fold metallo-hydrolase n=1 Tax=Ferruginibacter yonginensis TaxID=1310416 RepID=A0ABV8QTU8_9BACT